MPEVIFGERLHQVFPDAHAFGLFFRECLTKTSADNHRQVWAQAQAFSGQVFARQTWHDLVGDDGIKGIWVLAEEAQGFLTTCCDNTFIAQPIQYVSCRWVHSRDVTPESVLLQAASSQW